MLSRDLQRKLAERYAGDGIVKEAFDKRVAKAFNVEFADERKEYAAVAFVDIAGFSEVARKMTPEEVRKYLDDYYSATLPALYKRGGMIDRIAGDGILAVFSPFFTGETKTETDKLALDAAETIVAELSGGDHSSKAAVSYGNLVFCKTGVANIYEEYTAIGNAITRAYRIEGLAKVDQVVVQGSPRFASIIKDQVSQTKSLGYKPRLGIYNVVWAERGLRGVGAIELIFQTLRRSAP